MRFLQVDMDPDTANGKRGAEENGASAKRGRLEKGFAPVKAEFVVDDSVQNTYDDDEAEGGERHVDTGKKKRRGQNKKRDLKQQHEAVRLCTSQIDPLDPKACTFSNCKNVHSVEEYLAAKPPDIAGKCPVAEAIGYCPAGLKCRWLGSHYDTALKLLLKDAEQMHKAEKENYEVNKIDGAKRYGLHKYDYDFSAADAFNKWMKTQTAELDEKKEAAATYVEAPFKVAEKKRIYLDRAKIVSPLTTVGNLPYRRLMKTLGADVTYSEMALALPLLQGKAPEWALPKAHISEHPGFGVQIASNNHEQAARAAEAIYKETTHVSELNLNCGCPIDLLYRQGLGSALMSQTARLVRIVKGMNAASGDIPVTVKLRTGTKTNKNTAVLVLKRLLAETSVAAVTLHGRSREQRYTKEANWDYIAEVGKVVQDWNAEQEDKAQRTWFIGNGDVYTHEQWHDAVNTEGIDSVMVARGALIKPWIFEEVEAQQYLDKSASERLEYMRQYAQFALEHWGSDEYGLEVSRRYMCEFIGFTHRYIPVGILERLPPKLNERPPKWRGRNEMETLLGSSDYKDWIKITEMFLGKALPNFSFTPKHKSNAY